MRTAAAAVVALLLLASPVLADPSPPLSEALSGRAKESYEAGRFLFTEDPAGALAKFEQAYDESKDPRLLFNMAACAKALKRYARMQSLLERYLREAEPTLTPEAKAQGQDMLAAAKGFVSRVTLGTTEADADVLVDGELVGKTPLAQPLVLDVGPRRIDVRKQGFTPFTQTLVVKGGEEQPLPVTLVRESARIVVSAGENDTIAVDGAVVGKARFAGTFPPGGHSVLITAPGRRPYRAQVDLAADGTRTLDVTLEKDGLPTWAWIAGGAVIVAGAVVGGYFLFKPKDEQSPQPTTTLGSVDLARAFR